MERYTKDPKLKGIYVKRCKCGARPHMDNISIGSSPTWIACNCGRGGESDTNIDIAIENWNKDKLNDKLKYN
jgi:hypothetical protein